MEKISEKIIEAGKNWKEWIKCLQESGDPEFVRQNVEHEIGENLNNKKLWKLYIEYLRKTDPPEMLQVYSKYCRYFLEDEGVKQEYKNEAMKHGCPVPVPWKNPFEFECSTPLVKREWDFDEVCGSPIPRGLPRDFVFPKREGTLKQSWSLPTPLIQYIRDNNNSSSTLQKTCKYFAFHKNSKLFCYRFVSQALSLYRQVEFRGDSILVSPESIEAALKPYEDKKLIITTSLHIWWSPESFLTNFIQKHVHQCQAKYIYLENLSMTFEDLEFLTIQKTVESLTLEQCSISTTSGKQISVEDILCLVPNIRDFV